MPPLGAQRWLWAGRADHLHWMGVKGMTIFYVSLGTRHRVGQRDVPNIYQLHQGKTDTCFGLRAKWSRAPRIAPSCAVLYNNL